MIFARTFYNAYQRYFDPPIRGRNAKKRRIAKKADKRWKKTMRYYAVLFQRSIEKADPGVD